MFLARGQGLELAGIVADPSHPVEHNLLAVML